MKYSAKQRLAAAVCIMLLCFTVPARAEPPPPEPPPAPPPIATTNEPTITESATISIVPLVINGAIALVVVGGIAVLLTRNRRKGQGGD